MSASRLADPQQRIADSYAIYDLIEQLQESWNAHDGARFAHFFCEHADCTAWNGLCLHGRTAIGLSYLHLFGAYTTNLTLEMRIMNIRFLADTVCLAHAGVSTSLARPYRDEFAPRPKPRTPALFVLTKQNHRWRCEVLHITGAQSP